MRRDREGEEMTLLDLSRTQIEILIHEWITGRNAERDRAILARRLFDGITYERIAEEFEMSPRQIRTIVHAGEARIFSHIPGC